jgi:hypothetical protein
MVRVVKDWLFSLVSLLACVRGEESGMTVTVPTDEGEGGNSDEGDSDGAGVDGGNNDGKKRSESIPRERFDKVNASSKA